MATVFISDFIKPNENRIKFFNPTEKNYTILVKVKSFLLKKALTLRFRLRQFSLV